MLQLLMLYMLPQLLPAQLSMLPQLWLMLSMPQLLPRLPQLIMLQLQLMLMRSPPTPTPMLLPMTTPRLTSMPRRPLMAPAMSREDTLLLFLMAESNMSSTPPMHMMDMLLMSPMRELLPTQRLLPPPMPQ